MMLVSTGLTHWPYRIALLLAVLGIASISHYAIERPSIALGRKLMDRHFREALRKTLPEVGYWRGEILDNQELAHLRFWDLIVFSYRSEMRNRFRFTAVFT
jgi:hypothetical protein